MRRQILSMALAAILVIGQIPVNALADESINAPAETLPEETTWGQAETLPEETACGQAEMLPEETVCGQAETLSEESAYDLAEMLAGGNVGDPLKTPEEENVDDQTETPEEEILYDQVEEQFWFEELADATGSGSELLSKYVDQQMHDFGTSPFSSDYGLSQMPDDLNRQIYAELKDNIEIIAANGGSTEITFSLPFSEDERILFTYPRGASKATIENAAGAAFRSAVPTALIVNCLRIDCPYELYWWGLGCSVSYGYSYAPNGSAGEITSIMFSFTVAAEFAAGDSTTVKAPDATTDAIAKAKENALAVVWANEGKDDLAKLTAYSDYICSQVKYNSTAAYTENFPYGNPWQLIYVFDDNNTTDVVCEGYSKAFQYLCELTLLSGFFSDEYFASYLVTGDLWQNGKNLGGHMWNHVTLNDVNYLVDVTNVDGSPSSGHPLFMNAEPDSQTPGKSYSVDWNSLEYVLHDTTKEMYPLEILELGARVHTYEDGACAVCGREQAEEPAAGITPTCSVVASATVTAPAGGWKQGTNTFTVSCDTVCYVAVSYDGGTTYTRLTAAEAGSGYSFTAENMTNSTILAVGMKGDANKDGKISAADYNGTRAIALKKKVGTALGIMAVDTNNDGIIKAAEYNKLRAVVLGKSSYSW